MNVRHAAALALVGWYLMVPPASDWTRWQQTLASTKPQQGGGDYDVFGFFGAPLLKWKQQGEFDSQTDCEKARQQLRTRDGTDANQSPRNAKQYTADHAWCIATDDPRLKER